MASKTISDLSALAGTAVATGDLAGLWHVADSAEEKVLVEQLLAAVTRLAAASGGIITLTFAATGSGAGNDVVVKGSSAGSGATAGGSYIVEPGTKSGAGADGKFVVRQPGGTPGTNELQISHDGTSVNYVNATAGNHIFNQPLQMAAAKLISTTGAYFTSDTGVNLSAFGAGVGVIGTAQITFNNPYMSTTGFFQMTAGHLMADTSPTNATNTLASTNLAWTLIAGRSYSIKGKISGGNSTVTEGFKFALTADGTLTATTFDLAVVGTNGTVVAGTQRVTSLGTAITFTTFTAPSDVSIIGEIKCGVSGVLTLQFAETSAHTSGTATLNAGSWIELNDSRAV